MRNGGATISEMAKLESRSVSTIRTVISTEKRKRWSETHDRNSRSYWVGWHEYVKA